MDNQIGQFSILKQLGDGLYLGKNQSDQSKVLVRNYLLHPNDRPVFIAQCKSMLDFFHPNLIVLDDVLESSNGVALVMEYAPGGSLAELLAHKNNADDLIDPELALYIAQNILQAAGYLHEQGIVAQDIRPVKVLFTADGGVKLADISDSYLIDHRLGTVPERVLTGYEAPEVLLGGKHSPQSDLYMVGEILYEMVTGKPPFPIELSDTLYQRIGFGEFTPPAGMVGTVSADLNEIIVMAMSGNPTDRFHNAGAMCAALETCFP